MSAYCARQQEQSYLHDSTGIQCCTHYNPYTSLLHQTITVRIMPHLEPWVAEFCYFKSALYLASTNDSTLCRVKNAIIIHTTYVETGCTSMLLQGEM